MPVVITTLTALMSCQMLNSGKMQRTMTFFPSTTRRPLNGEILEQPGTSTTADGLLWLRLVAFAWHGINRSTSVSIPSDYLHHANDGTSPMEQAFRLICDWRYDFLIIFFEPSTKAIDEAIAVEELLHGQNIRRRDMRVAALVQRQPCMQPRQRPGT